MKRFSFDDISIFHGLSKKQSAVIKSRLKIIKFKKGDIVFNEGETANGLYIVRHGEISITRKNIKTTGRTKLKVCIPGDCFGEMPLFDIHPRSATAKVATPKAELYYLPYSFFPHLYEKDAALFGLLILNIAREVSRRLRLVYSQFF